LYPLIRFSVLILRKTRIDPDDSFFRSPGVLLKSRRPLIPVALTHFGGTEVVMIGACMMIAQLAAHLSIKQQYYGGEDDGFYFVY
jgi:hypothetical protein